MPLHCADVLVCIILNPFPIILTDYGFCVIEYLAIVALNVDIICVCLYIVTIWYFLTMFLASGLKICNASINARSSLPISNVARCWAKILNKVEPANIIKHYFETDPAILYLTAQHTTDVACY